MDYLRCKQLLCAALYAVAVVRDGSSRFEVYCQSSKVLCMDRNAIGLQSSPIGRPIGLLGSDRIAQNSKPTPVWAANIRHKASDLCSAATLGMTMPCLVSEWSRTSGLLRVACN